MLLFILIDTVCIPLSSLAQCGGRLRWSNDYCSQCSTVGCDRNASLSDYLTYRHGCPNAAMPRRVGYRRRVTRPIISDDPQNRKRCIACPPGPKHHCRFMYAHVFCFDSVPLALITLTNTKIYSQFQVEFLYASLYCFTLYILQNVRSICLAHSPRFYSLLYQWGAWSINH